MKEHSFNGVIGKRVLIKGESHRGKTKLLEEIIKEALIRDNASISLIDMAPEKVVKGRIQAGGLARVETHRLRYYRPTHIFAPRLQGRSKEDVIRMAEENGRMIETVLDNYLKNPTSTLFINDLTIYLHARELEKLQRAINSSDTFVGTAYEGESIVNDHGSGINEREKELLKSLERNLDWVIIL